MSKESVGGNIESQEEIFAGVIKSIFLADDTRYEEFEFDGKRYPINSAAGLAYATARGRTEKAREVLAQHEATLQ